MKFKELDIKPEILKAVLEMGITETTLVQEKVIPTLEHGKDVIILSGTGSGKTIAFSIPAIESVNPEIRKPQVLVITPTRELAMQVEKEMKKLTKYTEGIKVFSVYGGQPISRQIQGLKSKPNVIVGTPGRILDHIKRRTLKLETVNMLILDEADEMLKMGFREDIEQIGKKLAGKHQSVLASATMNKEIKDLTKKFLTNPDTIDAGSANSPAKSISQEYITVKPRGKKKLLIKLLKDLDGTALVFSNTKRMTTSLFELLEENEIDAKEIHGDMRQHQRTRAMNAFKAGKVKVLVATDVAARGIDVNNISYVINYDYPAMQEYYIHRIGRTGRAKQKGKAVTFITNGEDLENLNMLEKKLGFTVSKSSLSEEIKLNTKSRSLNSQTRNRFNQKGGGSYNKNSKSKKPYTKKEAAKKPKTNKDYGLKEEHYETLENRYKQKNKKRPNGDFKKRNQRAENNYKSKTSRSRSNDKNKGRKTNAPKGKPTSPKEYFGKNQKSRKKLKGKYNKK